MCWLVVEKQVCVNQGGIRATGHELCVQHSVQRTAQVLLKAGAEAHLKDWKVIPFGGCWDANTDAQSRVSMRPGELCLTDFDTCRENVPYRAPLRPNYTILT